MSESEFTKEEWVENGLEIWARGKGIIAKCPVPDKGGVMECVANARLIINAPKLLRACKQLLEYMPAYYPASRPVISNAKAVIAAAEKG